MVKISSSAVGKVQKALSDQEPKFRDREGKREEQDMPYALGNGVEYGVRGLRGIQIYSIVALSNQGLKKIRFKMSFQVLKKSQVLQGAGDSMSFKLTEDQAEVIQTKMPTQYSLLVGAQKREQRQTKKVSRYDATFAEAQTPRAQRTFSHQFTPAPAQKRQHEPRMDQPMSAKEKRILGQNIRDLPPEHLRGVWEIVSEGGTLASGEELEFDIDTLPPRIARKLERFVNQKLASTNKTKKVKTDQPNHPPVVQHNPIPRVELFLNLQKTEPGMMPQMIHHPKQNDTQNIQAPVVMPQHHLKVMEEDNNDDNESEVSSFISESKS